MMYGPLSVVAIILYSIIFVLCVVTGIALLIIHRRGSGTRVIDTNKIMSGVHVPGYDRQAVVERHRNVYGVRCRGGSLDNREVFELFYQDVGL